MRRERPASDRRRRGRTSAAPGVAPRGRAVRRVVVTAGPTREHLDAVRFLTNASTGRMGHALAREAARRGARVTLVRGPCALPPLPGVRTLDVVSTEDLWVATRDAARRADLVLFAAAPADWRPRRRRRGKPPREGGAFALDLVPTRDVAAALGRRKGRRIHVGFALETRGGEARARAKMAAKRFDAVVLNTLENLGRGGGEAQWIPADGASESLPTSSKTALARAIVARAWRL